ncbi:MAG: hypothetical protein JNM24_00980 [Bdellovibrionaceae bacterium]|nr:hypothetical protein [Pseudobdellovibrionaceae bacterium]
MESFINFLVTTMVGFPILAFSGTVIQGSTQYNQNYLRWYSLFEKNQSEKCERNAHLLKLPIAYCNDLGIDLQVVIQEISDPELAKMQIDLEVSSERLPSFNSLNRGQSGVVTFNKEQASNRKVISQVSLRDIVADFDNVTEIEVRIKNMKLTRGFYTDPDKIDLVQKIDIRSVLSGGTLEAVIRNKANVRISLVNNFSKKSVTMQFLNDNNLSLRKIQQCGRNLYRQGLDTNLCFNNISVQVDSSMLNSYLNDQYHLQVKIKGIITHETRLMVSTGLTKNYDIPISDIMSGYALNTDDLTQLSVESLTSKIAFDRSICRFRIEQITGKNIVCNNPQLGAKFNIGINPSKLIKE